MTHISAPEDVGALWLQLLQRAMTRASHDVKDALNGVSVNLEVIRSRAERADTPATAVAQFAEAAANQLDRLTTLLEAVLVLGRPEREPVDVAFTLRRVATLCNASSSNADAAVRVAEEGMLESTTTRVDGSVTRIALLAPLLEASAGIDKKMRATEVTCTIGTHAEGVVVMMAAGSRRVAMPELIVETLRAGGVRWTENDSSLSLIFPRA